MYLRQNKLAEAAQYADELRNTPNGDIAGRFMQGRLALARPQPADAMTIFQEVIKRQPTFAPAHYYLGLAHLQNGNIQLGRIALTEAMKQAPAYVEPRLALASLYLQTREFSLAIEAAQKWCRPNHTIPKRSYSWAEPTRATAKAPRRFTSFKTATDHSPQDPAGYYYLGLGYRAQKQEGQALQAFEKALSLNPNLIDALSQVVDMYLTKKEPAKALARGVDQLRTAPQDPLLYNLLGSIYLAQHKDTEAESAFRRPLPSMRTCWSRILIWQDSMPRTKRMPRRCSNTKRYSKPSPTCSRPICSWACCMISRTSPSKPLRITKKPSSSIPGLLQPPITWHGTMPNTGGISTERSL